MNIWAYNIWTYEHMNMSVEQNGANGQCMARSWQCSLADSWLVLWLIFMIKHRWTRHKAGRKKGICPWEMWMYGYVDVWSFISYVRVCLTLSGALVHPQPEFCYFLYSYIPAVFANRSSLQTDRLRDFVVTGYWI